MREADINHKQHMYAHYSHIIKTDRQSTDHVNAWINMSHLYHWDMKFTDVLPGRTPNQLHQNNFYAWTETIINMIRYWPKNISMARYCSVVANFIYTSRF